jgi:uncharacterized membrane protein
MKERVEALSDGVFAIVMTLLVIEIHIPKLKQFSEQGLIQGLSQLTPQFGVYFLTFALIGSYWVSHHITLSVFAKNFDRYLVFVNSGFLSFISLLPFSASLLGKYPDSQLAIGVYSLHILILSLFIFFIRWYITNASSINNLSQSDLEKAGYRPIDRFYANVRLTLPIVCSILAVILSLWSTAAAIVLLLIPLILGYIPGSIAWLTKYSGLQKLFKVS